MADAVPDEMAGGDDETDPEKANEAGDGFDAKDAEEEAAEINGKLASAAQAGEIDSVNEAKAEMKASVYKYVTEALVKAGYFDTIEEAEAALQTVDDVNEDFRNSDTLRDGVNKARETYSDPDKARQADAANKAKNDALSSLKDRFAKKYCKLNNVDMDDMTAKQKAVMDKYNQDWNDAANDPAAQEQAISDMVDSINEIADKFAEDMDKPGSKASVEGRGDMGEETWEKILKILSILAIVGSILAAALLMAILGESDDGCYMFTFGSKDTNGTGPMQGSKKPKILGFAGGGSVDGDCPGGGNITSDTCLCNTTNATTPPGPQDNATVTAYCATIKSPSSDDKAPYCCVPNGAAQAPMCTTPYATNGDVYYRWHQIDPSDVLGNIFNGLEKTADDAGAGIGGFIKNLFDNLGALKWVVWVFLGIVVLWVVVEIISFAHSAFGKKGGDGERVEYVEAAPSPPPPPPTATSPVTKS